MPRPDPAPWLDDPAIATAGRILRCHQLAFGRPLLAGVEKGRSSLQAAQELFAASEVVLAHDGAADPRLIYANRAALRLWRRPWNRMVGLPSRLTAEPGERRSRAVALERARRCEALEGLRRHPRGQHRPPLPDRERTPVDPAGSGEPGLRPGGLLHQLVVAGGGRFRFSSP